MSPLNPGRISPESRRPKAAPQLAAKLKRSGRQPPTDREAQAASFIHRRQMQRIRRIGLIAGTAIAVIGGPNQQ